MYTDVMRMNLNSFICDNFFLNLYDLSINDGANNIVLKPDVYLSYSTFLSWINTQLAQAGSTLVINLIDQDSWQANYLTLTGSSVLNPMIPKPFSLTGSDWFTKLGFVRSVDNNLSALHTAISPFDFAQSACVLIRFTNLPAAITNSLNASFHINNNNTFGNRIERYFFNYNSNQCIVFSQPQ